MLHQQMPKPGVLPVFTLAHELEGLGDRWVRQREQSFSHAFQKSHGYPQGNRQALADDGIPDVHYNRKREAINEKRQEPLPQVHVWLHTLPNEMLQEIGQPLCQELVARLQIATQQGETFSVEACEANMVHQADQDAEALLLAAAASQEKQQACDAVHALAVAHSGIVGRIGVQHPMEGLALLLIETLEGPVGVSCNQLRPLVLSPAEFAVMAAAR
mmetsp:Transcript_87943/g.244029  ORF Transcript_87943/g.244029 Transcript_87943/m.244029 type:complete len:216 (+) Transcript_87943:122-769(+)